MSYTYTNGQGLAALNVTEPADSENVAVSDEALIQLKKYLLDPTVGPDAVLTQLKATVDSMTSTGADSIPVGFVSAFPVSGNVSGWLLCNGAAVSRETYAALFALIGVSFGSGDNLTTFNLPDLSGKLIVGEDRTFNVIPNAVYGETIGSNTHTLVEDELPSHDHKVEDKRYSDYIVRTAGASNIVRFVDTTLFGSTYTRDSGSQYVQYAGGDIPHSNLMPSLTLEYYIKT